jgi:hypothetical protein
MSEPLTPPRKALRDFRDRAILCEWWLAGRRQCRSYATVEIEHPGFEAPHRFCGRHAQAGNR